MRNVLILIVVLAVCAFGYKQYNQEEYKVTPFPGGVASLHLNSRDNFIVCNGAKYEVNREGQAIDVKILIGYPSCLVRDDNGNEWIGTDKGLVKLTVSGEEKVYPYGETTIPNWNVSSLEIKDGCLYVGSGLYETGKEGGLTVINSLDDPENLTEANYTTYFVGSVVKSIELYNDEVWFVSWNPTDTARYSVQKLVNGALTKYSDPNFLYNPRFVRVDGNGVVWVANTTTILEETWISRFDGNTWTKKVWDDTDLRTGDINAKGIFMLSSDTLVGKIDVNNPSIEIEYEKKAGNQFFLITTSYKGNFLVQNKDESLMEEKAGSPIITNSVKPLISSVMFTKNYIEILKPGNFNINLFQVNGKNIWNKTISQPGKTFFSSSVRNLSTGHYCLVINAPEGKFVSRFVITK